MNQLEQLRQFTTVVADTGDFQQLGQFRPRDATTNPSLILKAVQQPAYGPVVSEVVHSNRARPLDDLVDAVLVRFGAEILKVVPGRVSTEVDARLSFDTQGTIRRAHRLVDLYAAAGIDRSRVLIKMAATWEGIRAAERLERDGIHCNLTLLFALSQAVACADAGVKLISPFVGRIYDWYKKSAGSAWDEAAHSGAHDPGVRSVRAIHQHYRRHGITTEVMGASFRNVGQILALAGCDLLSISPDLLAALQSSDAAVVRQLDPNHGGLPPEKPPALCEQDFRWALNEDAMASEKLGEGIRAFAADARKLDELLDRARQ